MTLGPSRSESLKTVASLRTSTKLLLRGSCLLVPLAYFAYVASFYVAERTYCTPGGVDRFEAFEMLESMLFHKDVCVPNPYLPASASKYMEGTFQAWAHSHWHPQEAKKSYEVVCRFNLLKNGTIEKLRIGKSSGDKKCDQAALAAFDSEAPITPADCPDRFETEFTFSYNRGADHWPVIMTDAVTPSQDQFLLEQGQQANYRSDYPRSKQLLLQCLEERRLRFKRGAPELTVVLRELADLYCRMGLLPQSQRYFDDAVANALLGEKNNPEALVETLRGYANQSFDCSKFAKALTLYKKCFSLDSKALDRQAKVRLAETNYAMGDYDSAVKIFAEVIRSDEHAPRSAEDLCSLDEERLSLCDQYINAGHPELAIKRIDSCLSQYHAAKTSKSKKESLELVCALLPVYEKLSDSSLGKSYVQIVFAELSKVHHPLSATVRNFRSSLASILWKSGDRAGAVALFEQLVAKYDANAADRAYALFDQAKFLFDKEKYLQAERSVREAQNIRMRLYDRNDQRVTNLKFALAAILIAEHRAKEVVAVINDIEIPVNADSNMLWRLSSNYLSAGQSEKALEIIDDGIRQSYKENPKDEQGERSSLFEQAIFLSRKMNDDKRLENYLNDCYKSELKRIGCASRARLVQFYLSHNRLAMAENLANREVTDTVPKDQSMWSCEKQAISFLLLAQVKDAQQRHDSAKYYVVRAIEASEPYGRSAIHITAVGLLAQILVKEGNLKSAERLLENLYNSELIDTDTSVCRSIVAGFNTSGCYFSGGSSNEYKEANGQRFDSEIYANSSDDYFSERSPRLLPMIVLDWSAAHGNFDDFVLLQASTLEARARIQTLESKNKEAADSRALLFENIEATIDEPSFSRELEGIERLLMEIPKSASQQKLLQRVRERIKQRANAFL